VPTLRRLVAAHVDINARDASGRTALMLAVLQGQKQAVDTLLAAGADPNAADASGTTPLHAALASAQYTIAAALEKSGAR
jgi:ankyrin repeat protein